LSKTVENWFGGLNVALTKCVQNGAVMDMFPAKGLCLAVEAGLCLFFSLCVVAGNPTCTTSSWGLCGLLVFWFGLFLELLFGCAVCDKLLTEQARGSLMHDFTLYPLYKYSVHRFLGELCWRLSLQTYCSRVTIAPLFKLQTPKPSKRTRRQHRN
jgi:hypothetical protein